MKVECPEAQVLKQFKLGNNYAFRLPYTSVWYNYTCCEAEASRQIYLETPKVGGIYFFDLMSKQNIDTKDFNAITSFNGKQYFSINDEETFDKSFTNLYNLPKPKISRPPIMFNMTVSYLKFEGKAM